MTDFTVGQVVGLGVGGGVGEGDGVGVGELGGVGMGVGEAVVVLGESPQPASVNKINPRMSVRGARRHTRKNTAVHL